MENLNCFRSSQGGALSIMVTALDKRIKSFTALYPALSDQTGFCMEEPGWPQYFRWFKPNMFPHIM